MVKPILSNQEVLHNHPHSELIEKYLQAYDDLFVRTSKVFSLATMVELLDSEILINVPEQIFWNSAIIADEAKAMLGELDHLDKLQKHIIHLNCECNNKEEKAA